MEIPVRNLWLLVFYASRYFRSQTLQVQGLEAEPDRIPDLAARLLCEAVRQRLRRSLTQGFQHRESDLSRVRGRIRPLRTEALQLLERGKVACRYEELSLDIPRNQAVRAALLQGAKLAQEPQLRNECAVLAHRMGEVGVRAVRPNHMALLSGRFNRLEVQDRPMLSAAQLLFELALPLEKAIGKSFFQTARDLPYLRKLFEKAVAGFYQTVLGPQGWLVHPGKSLRWPVTESSPGLAAILPSMEMDIFLQHRTSHERIVIDTKFNSLLVSGRFGEDTLRSSYLYQLYTYLRVQETADEPSSFTSAGLLLHPALGIEYYENMVVQGHRLLFATIDLAGSASGFRERLLRLVGCRNERGE